MAKTTIRLPKGQASHALRHTFASHFIQKGGNILTLQKILGHSSLAMTMRYSHLAPEHLAEAVRLSPLAGVTLSGHSLSPESKNP
nr:tyrosine-type recombinase/integrase [Pseudomonas sp. MMS21 TM103]